jgi:hypothetical protein
MCRQSTLYLLAHRPMKLLSGRDAFRRTHRKTNALRISPSFCLPPFPMTAGNVEYTAAGRPFGSLGGVIQTEKGSLGRELEGELMSADAQSNS